MIYYVKCPEENCNENYVRETGYKLSERVIDHNIWDKISQIFKHFVDGEHKAPILYEFNILGGNYRRKKFRRKVSASLLIKEKRSTLNTQEVYNT